MKKEYFKSSITPLYIYVAFVVSMILLGNYQDRPISDFVTFLLICVALFLLVYRTKTNIFVAIKDGRHLTNSGYFDFKRDEFDILDIKYIYRFSDYVLKWYGSRMVFYIQMTDGKLRQSSLREVAYSNDTIIALLKRLKQIKPSIELDPEYQRLLEGKLFLENPSENTVSSIEARLKAKGERW